MWKIIMLLFSLLWKQWEMLHELVNRILQKTKQNKKITASANIGNMIYNYML